MARQPEQKKKKNSDPGIFTLWVFLSGVRCREITWTNKHTDRNRQTCTETETLTQRQTDRQTDNQFYTHMQKHYNGGDKPLKELWGAKKMMANVSKAKDGRSMHIFHFSPQKSQSSALQQPNGETY